MNETLCTRDRIGDLVILQPRKGYRFSIDSLLLADFSAPRKYDKILDIGCGCGIISLLLARKYPHVKIVGIEIQESLVHLAQENVKINRLDRRIEIIHGDIKKIQVLVRAGDFDYAVSNPPFRPVDSGRICPDAGEALARHEVAAGLDDVVCASRYALHPGGRLALIYPAELTARLISALRGSRLEPKRLQFVHPSRNKAARMVMAEACRDSGTEVRVLEPIFLDQHRLQGGRQTSQG